MAIANFVSEILAPQVRFFGASVPSVAALPVLFGTLFAASWVAYHILNADEAKKRRATEFGGPIGAAMMPILLPFLTYFLYFGCNDKQCISLNPFSSEFLNFHSNPLANGPLAFVQSVFSLKMFLIFSAWVFFQFLLYFIVPGPVIKGVDLGDKNHTRLLYRINAFRCLIVTLIVLAGLVKFGVIKATFGYDNFVQLLTASIIFSFLLSIYLYVYSIITAPHSQSDADTPVHLKLSDNGRSGFLPYDFWMGRSLNPRVGFLDLKYVCELRPGLILWSVLNMSMLAKQLERSNNELNYSMILVVLFHFYYLVDALWSEPAILTTMDITTDGFGFMLAFGDLTWVPFTYSLQARYIADHGVKLPWWALVAIVVLKLVGMYIFRSANDQKNVFRTNPTDPAVKDLKFIQTHTGSKLITSGWWGMSRHINYFGDMIMGLAWCLPTGFNHIIPYFYAIYFTALLINRQERDDEKCHRKYGKDWETYCSIVPARIIPGIY